MVCSSMAELHQYIISIIVAVGGYFFLRRSSRGICPVVEGV